MEDKDWSVDAENIFQAGLRSVQPKQLIDNAENFQVHDNLLKAGEKLYDLKENVYLVGFGKAALGLVNHVGEKIGSHLVTGIVSCPSTDCRSLPNAAMSDITDLRPSLAPRIQVFYGPSNNIPNEVCLEASQKIANLVDGIKDPKSILLTIITGGGSALLTLPVCGVQLDDMMKTTKLMSRGGCDINEMNTVRKQLDQLKGGGLAKKAYPMQVISLILSDIVGDPLDTIASGPTVPNQQSVKDAVEVLNRRQLWEEIPMRIQEALSNQMESEATSFDHVNNVVIGSNSLALQSAEQHALEAGYTPFILTRKLGGDGVETSKCLVSIIDVCLSIADSAYPGHQREEKLASLAQLMNQLNGSDGERLGKEMMIKLSNKRKICLLAGGEVTVQVPRSAGFGGRAAHTALSAVEALAEFEARDLRIVLLVGSTDGLDGPTELAGTWVTNRTLGQLERAGGRWREALETCDAYGLLRSVNDGANVREGGLTGTNVMDIVVVTIEMQ